MTIKFLHSSDFHAGAGRRLTAKEENPLAYLERQVWHWNRVVETARHEKVDFAIIAGDLFENAATTIEELLALYRVLQDFGKVCPVLVTPGNHDETTVGEFQQSYLKLLGIPNVTVTLQAPQSLKFGEISVLACPWTGLKKQDEFEAYLAQHHKGEQIVVLHECFKGIVTDVGWKATSGVHIPDIEGVKYFACGDIHRHQKLNLPHAWYSGAPGPWTFGDLPNKGCIVVEVRDLKFDWQPRFVPIASAIELHTVRSLEDIPKDSPHWYKLRVEASKVPPYIPPCVKDIDILPAKIDNSALPTELAPTGETQLAQLDYSEGVEELLTAAGYEAKEIGETIAEIQQVAASG
jgi:DNA repair exonuclease SbcCD nuclease subunit